MCQLICEEKHLEREREREGEREREREREREKEGETIHFFFPTIVTLHVCVAMVTVSM